MLRSLRVKNLALIRETEVEFGEGLNILTGETGAGKSLLIGSVNLALGGKFEKDMLRRGEENGLVELVFDCEEERLAEKLKSMDLEPSEDGTVILSRKLSSGKSICRINGETVTAKQVKELSELLIDIHGQHEHQSLLNKKNIWRSWMPMRERNLQNAQGGWLHFIMSVLPWRKRSQRKLWMIPPEAENSLWRNLNKRRSRMLPCSPEKMRNWNRRTAKCPTAEKLRKAWRRAINSVAMTRKTVPGIL